MSSQILATSAQDQKGILLIKITLEVTKDVSSIINIVINSASATP